MENITKIMILFVMIVVIILAIYFIFFFELKETLTGTIGLSAYSVTYRLQMHPVLKWNRLTCTVENFTTFSINNINGTFKQTNILGNQTALKFINIHIGQNCSYG